MERTASRIVRERGTGRIPTIVLGGFVPDSTEAVEFQRSLLKNFGDIYCVNYSRTGFVVEHLFQELADLIASINARDETPVVFSVSFGSGVATTFLRDAGRCARPSIKGVVMVSPVFCADDLVRPEGGSHRGVRMLEHTLRRIFTATAQTDIERHLARARRGFVDLFKAGCVARALTNQHHALFDKIMDVIEGTTAFGGYERVLALKRFRRPELCGTVFSGPALALLAEREDDVLVPTSPGLAVLRDPATLRRLFPRGSVRDVMSVRADDPVVHGSLILHHHCYNPLIETWYATLRDLKTPA